MNGYLNNPQPEVRKNAENAKDWVYFDEAVLFTDWFVDQILLTDY
jgi:hypothetical protein